MLLQDIEHLPAVLSLRDDFEIFFQREEPAEPIAEDRMVVRHYDSNLGLWRRAHGRRSIRAAYCSQTYSIR